MTNIGTEMVLTAKELVEELVGLVWEDGVLPSEIVVYYEDDDILAERVLFEELTKAEIPFVISFCPVCYANGVKFVPWQYRNETTYGSDYAYLLCEEIPF